MILSLPAGDSRGNFVNRGAFYDALHFVLTPRPNQAGSLQGSSHVSGNILAADDLENGSGWQQSKQNWALPAVVG